jgi:hypothetical protein
VNFPRRIARMFKYVLCITSYTKHPFHALYLLLLFATCCFSFTTPRRLHLRIDPPFESRVPISTPCICCRRRRKSFNAPRLLDIHGPDGSQSTITPHLANQMDNAIIGHHNTQIIGSMDTVMMICSATFWVNLKNSAARIAQFLRKYKIILFNYDGFLVIELRFNFWSFIANILSSFFCVDPSFRLWNTTFATLQLLRARELIRHDLRQCD